ncbi:hypothetical protein Syun_017276 [Stephania yunnanensis]|uniref:Uncharacterized protein n=1 Tax=Stephania yunnanensis TaxID=152371 RepID=A0AAP0J6S3_9MAGN
MFSNSPTCPNTATIPALNLDPIHDLYICSILRKSLTKRMDTRTSSKSNDQRRKSQNKGSTDISLYERAKFYLGYTPSHIIHMETDRLRQVIEKEMLKVETLMVECRDHHYKFDVSHCSSTLALSPMMLMSLKNLSSTIQLLSCFKCPLVKAVVLKNISRLFD